MVGGLVGVVYDRGHHATVQQSHHHRPTNTNNTRQRQGEQLHHKGIYLHAWRYEGRAGWAYQTPYPEWAQGFVKEGGEGDGGKEG